MGGMSMAVKRYEERLCVSERNSKSGEMRHCVFLKDTRKILRSGVCRRGFYIWVTFHQTIAVQKLFTRALDGVLINPGALYLPEDRQSLRLSYSYASLPGLEKAFKR